MALAKNLSLPIYNYHLLFSRGKRVRGNLFTLIFQKNKQGFPRLAILVGKSVAKKATSRNKIKRKISRSLQVNLKNKALPGIDLIVLPNKQVLLEEQQNLDLEMTKLLKKTTTNNVKKIAS